MEEGDGEMVRDDYEWICPKDVRSTNEIIAQLDGKRPRVICPAALVYIRGLKKMAFMS